MISANWLLDSFMSNSSRLFFKLHSTCFGSSALWRHQTPPLQLVCHRRNMHRLVVADHRLLQVSGENLQRLFSLWIFALTFKRYCKNRFFA